MFKAVGSFIKIWWVIILFAIGAWCVNIYKTTQLDFEAPYKAEVFRVAGILVAPLGVILSFVTFDEEEE